MSLFVKNYIFVFLWLCNSANAVFYDISSHKVSKELQLSYKRNLIKNLIFIIFKIFPHLHKCIFIWKYKMSTIWEMDIVDYVH